MVIGLSLHPPIFGSVGFIVLPRPPRGPSLAQGPTDLALPGGQPARLGRGGSFREKHREKPSVNSEESGAPRLVSDAGP